MTVRWGWLLVALLGCPAGEAPPPPSKPLAPRMVSFAQLQTSTDTVRGWFKWVAPDTSIHEYNVVVSASHGTWGVVLALDTLKTRGMVIALPQTPGDTSSFTVCVRSVRGADISAATCTGPKKPTRPLPAPPLVVWDSLKIASIQTTGWNDDSTQVQYIAVQVGNGFRCVRSCPAPQVFPQDTAKVYCAWALLGCSPV